jgi:apolipoprotein N-acyltransferase
MIVTGLGFFLSLALGVICSLGQAPYHLWPLSVGSLVALFWAYRSSESRRFAGVLVFAFAYGYFGWGLRWIAEALTFFPSLPTSLIPLALWGIPLVLALPHGLMAYGVRRYLPRHHASWALGAAWVVMEGIRGYLVLPFPWLFMGGLWGGTLPVLQSTALVGILGLSVAIFASVHFFIHSLKSALVTLGVWFLVAGTGYGVLHHVDRAPSLPSANTSSATIALVQPSWTQDEKVMGFYTPGYQKRLLSLSAQSVQEQGAQLIVWPETAIYGHQMEDPVFQDSLRSLLSGGRLLMMGVSVRETIAGEVVNMNQIWVVDEHLNRLATYTKRHLVPFGEKVPFLSSLPFVFLNQKGMPRFQSGPDEVEPLSLPGFPPTSPQICYESLFSGTIVSRDARWMVNVTNDAWFGDSWGPAQHFYQARVRTIEEGLPLIRVANTGKTAVVDAKGRILQDLPMDAAGVLVAPLPLEVRRTLYSYAGLWASGVFGFFMFFLCYRVSRR